MKLFWQIALLLLISKMQSLCVWESQILGRGGGKVGSKLEKQSFCQGNQGKLSQFYPGRIEAPLLHIDSEAGQNLV